MVAASTAARRDGCLPELPGDPQLGLVVPVRRRRVAGPARRHDRARRVDVREVDDDAVRGDDHRLEPVARVEPGLQDGLLVSSELVLARDEHRIHPGHPREDVREADAVQRAPSPRIAVLAERVGQPTDRVAQRVQEQLVDRDAGGPRRCGHRVEHRRERRAHERFSPGEVPIAVASRPGNSANPIVAIHALYSEAARDPAERSPSQPESSSSAHRSSSSRPLERHEPRQERPRAASETVSTWRRALASAVACSSRSSDLGDPPGAVRRVHVVTDQVRVRVVVDRVVRRHEVPALGVARPRELVEGDPALPLMLGGPPRDRDGAVARSRGPGSDP